MQPNATIITIICCIPIINKFFILTFHQKNNLPTLNTINETIQARVVVYVAAKSAHFQLPDSCFIAARVAIHGKYINTKNINDRPAIGVISIL